MARSKVLIARIARLIETNGRIGEGLELVSEYTEATTKVNERLDKVIEAIDAKQVSEAVRILQEPPPLIDEVSVLDFNLLDKFVELAKKRGWGVPTQIDRAAFEKVILLKSDVSVTEPLLKMYRKAVRLNDVRLSVQTLRQLVELDHSQDWHQALGQAEASLRKQLHSDFVRAKEGDDRDEMARIASEYVSEQFLNAPVGKSADEIIGFLDEEDKAEKRRKIDENLGIIRSCNEGDWDRELVERMVSEVEALVENGAEIADSDRGVVDMARERCTAERGTEEREKKARLAAEKKERRWKECREALFVAVEHEDVAEIRKARGATEFEDRPPEEELLRKADMIIRRAEELRMRKLRIIAFSALVVVACVLAVSWKFYQDKKYQEKCEEEVRQLESFAKGPNAIGRLGDALKRIRETEPDVYQSADVNAYEGRLATLIEKTAARTNEIASILLELDAGMRSDWFSNPFYVPEEGSEPDGGTGADLASDIGSVAEKISRVKELLTEDDSKYRQQLSKIELSWNEFQAEQLEAERKEASQIHETIAAHAESVAKELGEEYAKPSLLKAADTCEKSIEEWRQNYGGVLPELDARISNAEATLREARKRQSDYVAAIAKVNDASDAKSLLDARRELLEFYGEFREVKGLTQAQVLGAEAETVTDGTLDDMAAFKNSANGNGVDEEAFKSFLSETIGVIAEVPAYYALYGILWTANPKFKTKYYGVACGMPEISQPSAGLPWEVEGDVFWYDYDKREYNQSRTLRTGKTSLDRPRSERLEMTDEMRDLVDKSKTAGMSAQVFRAQLLSLIRQHLAVAAEDNYVSKEEKLCAEGILSQDWIPAIRRVQMMKFYLIWLRDELKAIPDAPSLKSWIARVEQLSQPVSVDGMPDYMSWYCLKDRRVAERDIACAKFLHEMSLSWNKDFEAAKKADSAKDEIAKWRVEYAGKLLFKPFNPAYEKNPNAVLPNVLPEVKTDHPLYVLRNVGGKLVLKKALLPQNEKWGVLTSMSGECMPGEPLFQVRARGEYIDTAQEFKRIKKDIPESAARKLENDIPLFDLGR